jgi:glucan phosphoethanolaminetransferase (alkaline phosphatase superfamily)
MDSKNSLWKFSLFIIIQLIFSFGVIVIFQQAFHLRPIVVLGHIFVISFFNVLILGVALILSHDKILSYPRVYKYFISSLYGLSWVLLYYSYLFAFMGESYNSRIFTSQIVIGYLKYLDEIIHNFSVSPFLVYGVLFIIPLFIFILFLWLSDIFYQGVLQLRKYFIEFISDRNTRYFRWWSSIIVVGCLLVITAIIIDKDSVSNRLFRMQEPFVSVFLHNNNPFDGQIISNRNEEIGTRENYPRQLEFDKKNVIIIVVDALRSDHLSLFGYERETSSFLDSLYSEGQLKKVELSFSVAGESFAGINGILRSKIWANMGYNNFSLPQLLGDQGYDLNFIISGDHTNFYGLKSFYGKNTDFNYYIDGATTEDYLDPNDDRIVYEGLDNIQSYGGNPSFFQFHLMSTHNLGVRLEEHKIFKPAGAKGYKFDNYENRYDNGVLQTDSFIRGIFQALSAKGYLDNSIIIISSDHGEALGERGQFGHGKNVYTDQLIVPIIIYDSDSVEYKNLNYATILDIAPTIIDRLGLPVPDTWEGQSLYSYKPRAYTYHQKDENYAIIHTEEDQQLKYIYNRKTRKQELYNLRTDLYETRDIIDSVDLDYIDSLRAKLRVFGIEPED